jgi:hypothetical protein
LGSWLRQGVTRFQAKRKTRESHHMLPGVQRMWGNEPSHSQVNSHCRSQSLKWTLKSLERNCKGRNQLAWRVPYIIVKLLKLRYLKWARISHLDISNTSYDQKKDRESNWQFDSRPLNVMNRPNFVAFRQRATYHWKAIDEGYNFVLNLIAIGGLHTKLRTPKVTRVPIGGISGLPLGSPGTKSRFGCGPRGEVQSILEGGRWWFHLSLGCAESCESKLPVAHPSTKSAPTMH